MRKLLFQSILRGPLTEHAPALDEAAVEELATALRRAARRRLGRSLSIREIDAGSCNGCELEIHALSNAYYDVERFGIRFLAAPRRRSHGHRARDQKHARCAGTNLSCDPRPEMGRCPGRLRAGWRMLRWQLRGGRRGLASRSRRPAYFRLPTDARYDFAGTSRPARSNDQNRRFDLKLGKPFRLLQAGLVAGCVQAGLASVVTPVVMVFAQFRG